MSFRTSKEKLVATSVSTNEAIGLEWVLRVLVARRFLVAAATLLGIIFSLLYLLNATPQYSATARILIEDQRPQIASGREIVRMTRLDDSVMMLSQVIDSQIALIQSPQQIEKVIDRLKLFEQPRSSNDGRFFGKFFSWLNMIGHSFSSDGQGIFEKFSYSLNTSGPSDGADGQSSGEMGSLERRDKRLRKFFQHLNVRRLNQTSIILVSYADADSTQAARVANAVAKAYIQQQAQTINEVKRNAVGWLKARASELQREVLTEEREIEEYKVRNGLVSVDGRMLLDREIMATMERLIETRSEAAGAEARAQLFGGGRSDAEVAKLRASIQEKDLKHLVEKLASATDVMVGLRELELKHKATRDVYAGVLSRLKEGEVQTSLQASQSRIVNVATPPLRPEWPRTAMALIMGSLGSAFLAVTFVLVQEFYLGIVRSPKDLNHKLQHIATLPLVGAGESSMWFKRIGVPPWRAWLRKLLNHLLPTKFTRVKHSLVERQVSADRASPYAQAMFALDNLMSRTGRGKRGVIFALVSAQEGEGKTMTALNLADYTATAGRKVLLIDADLRAPDLTETCAPCPNLSIVDIAEQKVDAGEVIINGIFDFCPGPDEKICRWPMEVLASKGLTRFLQEAQAAYDLVLIDTSPMLAYVDAKAVLENVDGIILLVEFGRTTTAQIEAVLHEIGGHCVKLLGFALNKFPRRQYENKPQRAPYS